MARSCSQHSRAVVWTRRNLPAVTFDTKRDIYAATGPGAVYRLRLLPIPYAVACLFGVVYFHGQRHAVQV